MLDWIQIDPVAFTIPLGENGFAVYWYGIIITLGIALGAIYGAREIEKRGQSADEYFNGLLVAVVAGYLFARLTYVVLDVIGGNGAAYSNIIDVINLRRGGVNILGGFIGAALVTVLYVRWRRLRLWHYADVAALTILLAQGIGRWGNFINQELYGPPTELPWGILIDARYRLAEYVALPPETRFHPTFLYESLLLLLGFAVLAFLNARYRDQWRPGTIFALFLIWWGSGRFIIEFFRPDQVTLGNTPITYSMLLALALLGLGVYLLLRLRGAIGRSQRRRTIKPRPRRS